MTHSISVLSKKFDYTRQTRRHYALDCVCKTLGLHESLKDFFVLLGIVFRLRLFFIEVDILLLYIINNELKINTKKFDHILVHIGHTSIKRPPLLSGHLAIPQGWPLNRGSTVLPSYGDMNQGIHRAYSSFYCAFSVLKAKSLN